MNAGVIIGAAMLAAGAGACAVIADALAKLKAAGERDAAELQQIEEQDQ